jgi:serine/threonine protein phosphatase PrpC
VRLYFAGITDVGRAREHNEDSFAIAEQHGVILVADGMGGHELGEVASKVAADAIVRYFEPADASSDAEGGPTHKTAAASRRLVSAIHFANQLVFDLAMQQGKVLGTTVVAAHLVDDTLCVAHVGDSRAYLVREGRIERLTRDHSALEEYKASRDDLTAEDIAAFPYPNVIMRALGTSPDVEVDSTSIALQRGDVVLLCCDGLSNMVDDPSMLAIVAEQPDLQGAAAALIAAANVAGGDDNITAVLARYDD